MWSENDPLLSLENSYSHPPFPLLPHAHYHNPLESRARFKGLHVIVHCEYWSQQRGLKNRENGQKRRERQSKRMSLGCWALLWLTWIQSLQDLLRCTYNAIQNSLSKGLGGEPLSTNSLPPSDQELSRVVTGGINILELPVLGMPEWWVDFWAESREVWPLRQGGVRLHLPRAGCCINTFS